MKNIKGGKKFLLFDRAYDRTDSKFYNSVPTLARKNRSTSILKDVGAEAQKVTE
jgi:hypothetical protein